VPSAYCLVLDALCVGCGSVRDKKIVVEVKAGDQELSSTITFWLPPLFLAR
jgi:hypothetical protein